MTASKALAILSYAYIRSSKLGLMLLAVREDEEKARSVGIRTTGVKLPFSPSS